LDKYDLSIKTESRENEELMCASVALTLLWLVK